MTEPDPRDDVLPPQTQSSMALTGSGAIAQEHGTAAGAGGVAISGTVEQSPIITGDRNIVNVTYQGVTIRMPSLEAVHQHRIKLRHKLEREAEQRWGGMGLYIREEGARLPIEASPYQPGLSGSREDLLQRLQQADRLIVLGEPGSGKTVALQRFAWEMCGDGQSRVPVLVPLLFYAGASLEDWMRAILQETQHLRFDNLESLKAFLKAGHTTCCFLFDGLNEVSPAQRERLREQLALWLAEYPGHPAIITSRVQDEQWRLLRQIVSDTQVIQPITDLQIEAYLKAGLGEEKGLALFDRLDDRLRTLAQRPLLLYLIKEAALHGESLPSNRGELYASFVARLLLRDTQERGLETRLPDHVKRQAATLLAYALHRKATLICQRAEAATLIEQPTDGDEIITALLRHGLLVGEEQLRFPHQTLQEYFAAEALREQVKREQKRGGFSRWWHSVRPVTDDLAALAADDWWRETLIQLAGLVDDSALLARSVARVNPWLAWWCVEEGRAVDEETRMIIEDRSINLLKSERVSDRRRAVQALSHFQSERIIDPLFRAVGDDNTEVAGIAAQSLLQLGEGARNHALQLLQMPDALARRSAMAYACQLPASDDEVIQVISRMVGQPVVYVPSGDFLMGSDKAKDPMAYDDELPPHLVNLPGYFIGRYPVTVEEYRLFVTTSDYQPRNQNSLKGQDTHPVVYVAWNDALAYCRWLSERSGLRVSSPSEAEWVKAARGGTDARLYPWGNTPPNRLLCNFNNNVKSTTPVGQYSPFANSPYGCAGMAGNVWEWTRSLLKPFPYDADDGREDLKLKSSDIRVLCGGGFSDDEITLRCTCRLRSDPYLRADFVGFRLVVSPF